MKSKLQSNRSRVGRREFLKRTALACGALGIPQIVPSSVLGLNGATPPSERILMEAIGTGGRGTYDLSIFLQFPEVRFTAVCDVQKSRRDATKQMEGQTLVETARRQGRIFQAGMQRLSEAHLGRHGTLN